MEIPFCLKKRHEKARVLALGLLVTAVFTLTISSCTTGKQTTNQTPTQAPAATSPPPLIESTNPRAEPDGTDSGADSRRQREETPASKTLENRKKQAIERL